MKIHGRVVVVTGAGSGIGRAMCLRFAQEGAAGIVAADLNAEAAAATAREVNGLPFAVDVTDEAQVQALVNAAIARYGRIDLFCSNAGILQSRGEDAPPEEWQRSWNVHVMGHVHAARAVLPHMLARGEGYLLHTASAAGLLTHVEVAPYAVTKHAAVSYAEWLAITYGDRGIRVSCLCPQGVRTPMLMGASGDRNSFLLQEALAPEDVAACVVKGLEEERFLILPHPEVLDYLRRKTSDYDRWLGGMRKLRARIFGSN
jgi:NAD(P)-dependent dehydrogenase (short-subunit alcohol dehydrogenase family)